MEARKKGKEKSILGKTDLLTYEGRRDATTERRERVLRMARKAMHAEAEPGKLTEELTCQTQKRQSVMQRGSAGSVCSVDRANRATEQRSRMLIGQQESI